MTATQVEHEAGLVRQTVRNAVEALRSGSVEAVDQSTTEMAHAAEHLQSLIRRIEDLNKTAGDASARADKPLQEAIEEVRRNLNLIALLLHQLIQMRTGWMTESGYSPNGITVEPPASSWSLDG